MAIKAEKKTMKGLEIVAGEKQIDTKKAATLSQKKKKIGQQWKSHTTKTRATLWPPQQANKNVKKKKKEEEYNDPT